MRFIFLVIMTVILVVFLNPVLPFWVIMILIGALAGLIGLKGAESFLAGGLGMGLAWLGQSLYISVSTGSPLPNRMGELMGLGSGMTLAGITAVLGFLLGGFSAMTGSLLRNLLMRKPDNLYRG
ncbi:MAG: hypothetical protein PSV36_10040 [Algoriphagus sp.]|nr:hypothetical protein [Algoriphagus sp.]